LPTLRFGGTYRFRARAVDIAGNSVRVHRTGAFNLGHAGGDIPPLRACAFAVLVPTAPRTPGEHIENLVIRSNYDISDDDPSIVPCERHIAPPLTGEDMAETHGVLDGADGHPDPSSYALIADRDGFTYKSSSVRDLYGGLIDTQSSTARTSGSTTRPRDAHSLASGLWRALPAGRARERCGPAQPARQRRMPSCAPPFDSVGTWPDRRAVRLVVSAGKGAPSFPARGPRWCDPGEGAEGIHHGRAHELVFRAAGPGSHGVCGSGSSKAGTGDARF